MKKIIRLTESQLIDVVKRVISEQASGDIQTLLNKYGTANGMAVGLKKKYGNIYNVEDFNYNVSLPIDTTDFDDVKLFKDRIEIYSNRVKTTIDTNGKVQTNTI
jgi:acetylglutamate kinase